MQPSPSLLFRDNLQEVFQLLVIHRQLTGTGPGRRHQVDVLNKSAVLFLCASFEAFVEDLASKAFDHLIEKSPSPLKIPVSIRRSIASRVKEDPHELRVWDLADDGWKKVSASYKTQILKKHVGPFNTPKHGNIAGLYKELIGFDAMDSCFKWRGMQSVKAKEKLNAFVELRGGLAHGQRPPPRATKKIVLDHIGFLGPLSVRMSNVVGAYCRTTTGHAAWGAAVFGSIE